MNSKQTTVYKVVDRMDGKLFSAFVGRAEKSAGLKRRRYATPYEVGKPTLPRPGTKLFAFKKLSEAQLYTRMMNGRQSRELEVYRATATNVVRNGWMDDYENVPPRLLVKMFEKHEMHTPDDDYKSCVVCDSITLVSRVQ